MSNPSKTSKAENKMFMNWADKNNKKGNAKGTCFFTFQ